MSGQTCPSCGCPFLWLIEDAPELGKLPARCGYCGWKGDIADMPRESLPQDLYAEWDEKMERKRKGALIILRVLVDETENERVVFDLMDVLGKESLSSRKADGQTAVIVELDTAPSDEMIAKIRAIAGVKGAEVV